MSPSKFTCIFVVQILTDRGIHGNLITFVTLLLANQCFHLHDIITYIIRPIMRTQVQQSSSLDLTSQQAYSINALEFISSLILHLFVSDYTRGMSGVGADTPTTTPTTPPPLPQFVQHCLRAKCRDLSLGYILMLLKDVTKVNQQLHRISMAVGGGMVGVAVGVVSKSEHNTAVENVLNKVRILHTGLVRRFLTVTTLYLVKEHPGACCLPAVGA